MHRDHEDNLYNRFNGQINYVGRRETISFVDSKILHADCLGNYSKTSPNCLDECYTGYACTGEFLFFFSFVRFFQETFSSKDEI